MQLHTHSLSPGLRRPLSVRRATPLLPRSTPHSRRCCATATAASAAAGALPCSPELASTSGSLQPHPNGARPNAFKRFVRWWSLDDDAKTEPSKDLAYHLHQLWGLLQEEWKLLLVSTVFLVSAQRASLHNASQAP